MVIDRRPEYYDRAAASIAADALGFYVRAERGRRLLLGGFPWPVKRKASVVVLRRARG